MDRALFYTTFFEHIYLFLFSMIGVTLFTYISLRKISIAGIIDPLHFYWTFTFGTAYGIILALYLNGDIYTHTFIIILMYSLTLIFFSNIFLKKRIKPFNKIFLKLFVTKKEPRPLFYIILVLFILNTVIILYFIGFGFLAEENRFEQNRGMGIFIRVFAVFRLFLISYFTLMLNNIYKKYSLISIQFLFIVPFFIIFIIFTALLDGAKFAFLESIIIIILALTVSNKSFKISFIKIFSLAILSIGFAIFIYSINLQNNNLAEKKSSYLKGAPFVVEALSFRVLANADKYFLSLPNDVIEEVETKIIFVRLLAPIIGATRLSNILGYDVNDYSIGKQILLYWHPGFDIAGGPTSHYDLFAYKQLGFGGGFFWVILTAFILIGIRNISLSSLNTKFSISVFSVLWVRCFPILIEPPLGLGYIFDVFIILGLLSIFYLIIKDTIIKKV